jgi:hypothetical protein
MAGPSETLRSPWPPLAIRPCRRRTCLGLAQWLRLQIKNSSIKPSSGAKLCAAQALHCGPEEVERGRIKGGFKVLPYDLWVFISFLCSWAGGGHPPTCFSKTITDKFTMRRKTYLFPISTEADWLWYNSRACNHHPGTSSYGKGFPRTS